VKTYVWEYVSEITTNWHNGGGLLIITDGDPQIKWNEYRQEQLDNEEYNADSLRTDLPEPSLVYACDFDSGSLFSVMVFPDAGCC
jgi:hypothetical protein